MGDGPEGLLYTGTSVVSGVGQARVTATGARTQFGAIAQTLVEKAPLTEYERSALESGVRSPLDVAILAHQHPAIGAYQKRAELPFDFERRRVSVLVSGREGVQARRRRSADPHARRRAGPDTVWVRCV